MRQPVLNGEEPQRVCDPFAAALSQNRLALAVLLGRYLAIGEAVARGRPGAR